MAKVEAEYESELEESVLLRRRSEASDDDEEVEEEGNNMAVRVRLNRSVRGIGYADESDSRDGAPENYDDDDEEVSYVDELEKLGSQLEEERKEEVAEQVTATKQRGKEKVNDGDNDAFAVPRTGSFYMHDDRFSGLHRRSRDQRRKRKIWESKDELKWMHDKFEEMKLEKALNKEFNAFEVHRISNDYHQGPNKNNTKSGGYKTKESRLHSKSGNNGSSLKMVKGRGPVRYKPLSRSISVNPPMKNMQLEKIQGTSPKTDSARVVSANSNQHYKRSLGKTANAYSEGALSTKCKQPEKPFKMTGDTDSSTDFLAKTQSRNRGMVSHGGPASVSFSCLNDSVPGSIYMASPDSRDQKTIPFTHQATLFPNRLNRVSSLAQTIAQQMPVHSTIQSPSQVFTQQLHSHLWSGSLKVCEASSLSLHEPGIFESLKGSVQSKVASLGTGSNITAPPQYTGMLGDQNYSATPILFPVMQIGGLHHSTTAIDMTSTGYIGESQLHLRNPDLTWLPILPAAAGAVGATCQPPYVSSDGSCYGNFKTTPLVDVTSNATCASIPSNVAGKSGPSNGSSPSLDTDYVKKTAEQMKNECGIQLFKPTRYSRMNMKE